MMKFIRELSVSYCYNNVALTQQAYDQKHVFLPLKISLGSAGLYTNMQAGSRSRHRFSTLLGPAAF